MIIEDQSGNRAIGFYRGIVKKHLSHGRCKIFIPSVYDDSYFDEPDLLPSAQPATPLFAGTNEGNGCFSYPNLSSIVWCFFANDDVNYPVYFAATLGGEDAFGQYDIIKRNVVKYNDNDVMPEEVSRKHLITSGKTHIEWYENGKISAIVEDPIRTQCSTKYTDYNNSNDNISIDLSAELSNYNISAIDLLKLSNINCQFVLDNNANAHGELSLSTHWYNIISSDSATSSDTKNGTISIDNRYIMNNNGLIEFGTISTINANETLSNIVNIVDLNEVCNYYLLKVPGYLDEKVQNSINHSYNDAATGVISNIKQKTLSNRYMDVDANDIISSKYEVTKNSVERVLDQVATVNLTTDIEHQLRMLNPGELTFSTAQKENSLSGKSNGQSGSVYVRNINNKGVLNADVHSNALFFTISDEVLIDSDNGINNTSILSNKYIMDVDGLIEIASDRKQNLINVKSGLTVQEKGIGQVKFNSTGNFLNLTKYKNLTTLGTTTEYNNDAKIEMSSYKDAAITTSIVGLKTADGNLIVDALYHNVINTSTSTANILIVDNIAKKECVNNSNAKNGITEIRITNKATNKHCTITMLADGQMTIDTSDTLTISTVNSVTVNTKAATVNASSSATVTSPTVTINGDNTTVNGDTTMNGTLHVTGAVTMDSSAKIAADANIGGKSFLGHMHVGNMGAPTSPPV